MLITLSYTLFFFNALSLFLLFNHTSKVDINSFDKMKKGKRNLKNGKRIKKKKKD